MVRLKTKVRKRKILLIVTLLLSQSVNLYGIGDYKEDLETPSAIVEKKGTYEDYLQEYVNEELPSNSVEIPITEVSDSSENVKVLEFFEGEEQVLETKEEGYAEWAFNVPEEGWYQLKMEYYPLEGKSSEIERQLEINGEIPFFDAKHIVFSRVWANESGVQQDNRGNDLRPRQIEKSKWQTDFFKDSMGYYTEPYRFYFKQGENTLRLTSVREPLAIKSIKLCSIEETPDYAQIQEEYKKLGYEPAKGQVIKVQGEDAQYKSDPTLYPLGDRAAPNTEPYHHSKIRMNMIGDQQWKLPGQWIEWEVEIEEAGLYQIVLKERQDTLRGSFSNRKLMIDGEVPFKEVESIPFKFEKEWTMKSLGDEEPYLFYLDEGKHNIRLEVSLGDLGSILNIVENSIYELNKVYRNILMLTGATPDTYRDYEIPKRLPNVMVTMQQQSEVLNDVMNELVSYTGKKGSEVSTIEKLAIQLERLVDKPETIPKRLSQFKDNVASLGTWILTMREQPLAIDYILVQSPDIPVENVKVSFWSKMMHELRAFVASFVEDYNTIGSEAGQGQVLEVWVTTGRDQAQIIKGMIDDEFTPNTGIGVNIKLVDPSALLPATVSGNGPDVAMQVAIADPVNYAIRNAVADLTQFGDYKEIEKRFHKSAITPYEFDKGIYALPETQEFPMLFYRTDILEELGLEVPETWDDLIDLLSTIQKNHMNFAIPVAVKSSAVSVTNVISASGLPAYAMLLYQMGGELYTEDGSQSIIDSSEGVEAFEMWTELFVNYKLPLEYDFANRFRTGEIPIGITNYSMYNRLAVFAPEIRGLWEFDPVPGIMQEDGTINRSVASTGTGIIMMEASRQKEASWEYMKWWTSKDVQVRFGREMESLMGAAARYPTANQEALAMLPWSVEDYRSLDKQWEWAKGNPEVPGGYFTPRHIDNAFRRVVYEKEDPRETILDYVRVINEELEKKRIEFGLTTGQKGDR